MLYTSVTSVLVTAVVDQQLPNHEVALAALREYATGGNTGHWRGV
jgi:hypothetical protein